MIRVDKDSFKLATTRPNAEAGTAIDITSAGSEVRVTPQDFIGDVVSGTLVFDANNVDTNSGGTVPRGYFRVETDGTLFTGITNVWAAGGFTAVAERASGAAHSHNFPGTVTLARNNEGLFTTRTDGAATLVLRQTGTNTVQVGSLGGGTDNANLVGAGLATVVGGGAERFRAGATGVACNGVTTQVARRTVAAAATDLATTTALVNELRQLLIDLGFAQ